MHIVKVRLCSRPQATLNRQRWLNKPIASGKYRPWLISSVSLTAKLKQRYHDFKLQPLAIQHGKANFDEVNHLPLRTSEHAIVREVVLYGAHRPVVFAHSVLPKQSLRGDWCRLGKLGHKPLGEALFTNPKVTRTPLMYKKISNRHPLYLKAVTNCDDAPAYLWARRSVFSLSFANILVTEVFLPNLMF